MICRFCLENKHEEEMCDLAQTIATCDVCREEFDTSELCWECYWLPYPLRCCAECIQPEIDNQSDRASELAFYQRQLKGKHCHWCQTSIEDQPLEFYDHHGGYRVAGLSEKQWLYVTCPNCRYQWSAVKLGIREIEIKEKG